MRTRLGVFLLLATTAAGQQIQPNTSANSGSQPKLPVIEYDTCLGKDRVHPDWKILAGSPVYSSWQPGRTQVGALRSGERVTVVGGAKITREPDRILVTKPFSDLDLKPGEIILRYAYFAEGEANIWAKGVWHQRYNLWTTTEKDGRSGCLAQDACTSRVIEDGIHEMWVQVKTSAGLTGWVLDSKSTRGLFQDSGVFGQICAG